MPNVACVTLDYTSSIFGHHLFEEIVAVVNLLEVPLISSIGRHFPVARHPTVAVTNGCLVIGVVVLSECADAISAGSNRREVVIGYGVFAQFPLSREEPTGQRRTLGCGVEKVVT